VFIPLSWLFLQLGTILLNTGYGVDFTTAHRSDFMCVCVCVCVCVSILAFLSPAILKGPPLEERLNIWHLPPAGCDTGCCLKDSLLYFASLQTQSPQLRHWDPP